MIKEAIVSLLEDKNLSKKEAYAAMKDIMTGQATPSQIGGYLVALRKKGETVEEIAGMALAMRDSAVPLTIHPVNLVDCCGTGGDSQGGLNVSTAASFVVAAAGFTVAKHGNRSITSQSGSADVLEMMGIRVDSPTAAMEHAINAAGIGFLFAPVFHPAMKYAMPTRKELGFRTVFNILGPLTNPAKAQVQLIGVFNPKLQADIANVLKLMGHKAGLVVHSHGWDEITLMGPTRVSELFKGKVKSYTWTNKDFNLPRLKPVDLKGGTPAENAKLILDVLKGHQHPARHAVIANAAALIWISARAYNNSKATLKESVTRAEEALTSGRAFHKFQQLAEISHSLD
jgi:anthranilate phosphoribosyltransferase